MPAEKNAAPVENNSTFIAKLSNEREFLKVYIPGSTRELMKLKTGQKVKVIIRRV